MDGARSHRLVELAIGSLCNLEHRGATGAEVNTGDGAGISSRSPGAFARAVVDFELPERHRRRPGVPPRRSGRCGRRRRRRRQDHRLRGLTVLGWRDVPTDPVTADIGRSASA
ncbi:MAG: hypothetical protein U0Q22_07895 [Acidimicrobiales bacterium]